MKKIFLYACFVSIIFSINTVEAQDLKLTSSFFGSMEARAIGPAVMSGRITCIDAFNDD
jgi:hypothetical protein